MWLRNLFGAKQQQNQTEQKQIDVSRFQIQQTIQQSSPLIDQLPDLRYQSIKKITLQKIPFPHNLIDKTQQIIYINVQQQNGWTYRSNYSSYTHVKILCTDKQLLMSPNIFSLSSKSLNTSFLDIPLGQIQKIQIKQIKKQPTKLYITLKDSRQLIFTNKLGDQIKLFFQNLSKFILVNGINKFFAFQYKKKWYKIQQNLQRGWQVYNIRNQFIRQGAFKHFCMDQTQKQFKYAFRLIKNYSYDISTTYPPQFYIPFNISKEQIIKASKFRTRQRVPALTYFYEYKSDCFVSLFRCSQIKTGLMGSRSQEDQKVIKEIAQSSNFISKTKKIYQKYNIKIYDARGYYAALGNMLAGKGYQKQEIYNCQVQFLNIPNIHAVRDSYIGVKNSNYSEGIYQVLANTRWLQYVGLILTGAKEMAIDMMNGKNVLVHCSDGWDRTAQLSSLCQLLLDPYYRTIEGIAVLIEKDWRNFGHKFRQRTGQYHPTSYHPYQKSPVFIQFLDCIYQIMSQFPISFEYNSYLLQYLSKHINSCVYGTFLANNMKQSYQIKLQNQTVSIWSDILDDQKKDEFMNPFYEQSANRGFLNINLDMKNLNIWKEHLFYEKGEGQVALFSYRKQKLINKALKQQFYANEKLIEELNNQLADLDQI